MASNRKDSGSLDYILEGNTHSDMKPKDREELTVGHFVRLLETKAGIESLRNITQRPNFKGLTVKPSSTHAEKVALAKPDESNKPRPVFGKKHPQFKALAAYSKARVEDNEHRQELLDARLKRENEKPQKERKEREKREQEQADREEGERQNRLKRTANQREADLEQMPPDSAPPSPKRQKVRGALKKKPSEDGGESSSQDSQEKRRKKVAFQDLPDTVHTIPEEDVTVIARKDKPALKKPVRPKARQQESVEDILAFSRSTPDRDLPARESSLQNPKSFTAGASVSDASPTPEASWTADELEAAEGLLALSSGNSRQGTKPKADDTPATPAPQRLKIWKDVWNAVQPTRESRDADSEAANEDDVSTSEASAPEASSPSSNSKQGNKRKGFDTPSPPTGKRLKIPSHVWNEMQPTCESADSDSKSTNGEQISTPEASAPAPTEPSSPGPKPDASPAPAPFAGAEKKGTKRKVDAPGLSSSKRQKTPRRADNAAQPVRRSQRLKDMAGSEEGGSSPPGASPFLAPEAAAAPDPEPPAPPTPEEPPAATSVWFETTNGQRQPSWRTSPFAIHTNANSSIFFSMNTKKRNVKI